MIATSKPRSAQTLEDLAPSKLMKLAYARLEDAKILFEAKRYDGAFYTETNSTFGFYLR